MRTGKRTTGFALHALAVAVVVAAVFPSIACSSSSDAAAPTEAADSGAQDAQANADARSDAGGDAAADPAFNPDPQDLDPAGGDPSLDIAGSWLFFDSGEPWVRVVFYGKWPPAATLYAWSCQVFLSTENAPVVTYTVQSLTGTQTDSADGLDKAKITFAVEAKGFRVRFADATLAFDRYALQCTAQKTKTNMLVQDDSGSFTFTAKEQRPFGP